MKAAGLYVPADLYDANGLLAVDDDHPLAPLRFKRSCAVRALFVATPERPGICPWCGRGDVPARCRYHRSCAIEVGVRTSPSFARNEVMRRDGGVCSMCGRDRIWWLADHVVPMWQGGGCCGLANLRTLCNVCNEKVTSRSAAERAAKRRQKAWERKRRLAAGRPGEQLGLPAAFSP